MRTMRKGTIVQTSQGKIGEIVQPESWVIKNENDETVSETFENRDVCDTYRLEINSNYTIQKVPSYVKLGKGLFPIFQKNLKYLPTIFFKFKDFYGNITVLRQNQKTGIVLKKFLDKSNIKYYMYTSEEEMIQDEENVFNVNYNIDNE